MSDKIIYSVYSGSQLYGLTTPESDVDIVSVFMPTAYDLLSLQKRDLVEESTKKSSEKRRNDHNDIDNNSYSLPNYMKLILQGNPNLTEILFANPKQIIVDTPAFAFIKDNYEKFISKKVYDSFMGFAVSQRKKLEYKSQRFHELEKAITYLKSSMILDNKMTQTMAEDLNKILQHYKGSKHNIEHFHVGLPIDIIQSKIQEEYDQYGWRVHTESFSQLGFDKKYASHNLRLLAEGTELLDTGKITFPFTGEAYSDIMDVKVGKVPLDKFYLLSTKWEDKCRKAAEKSVLRTKPDFKWANTQLVQVLMEEINKEYTTLRSK